MKTRRIVFHASLCALLALQLGLSSALADTVDAGEQIRMSQITFWQ